VFGGVSNILNREDFDVLDYNGESAKCLILTCLTECSVCKY
jgi:hypothetical protein